MNDSFVDLDLIGQVHPENYKITKPSFYAELIWNSRTQRQGHRQERRLGGAPQPPPAYRDPQPRRVGAALDELARRVGFRVIPRPASASSTASCFPQGLTLLDLGPRRSRLGHIAARQELREMIAGLAIPARKEIEEAPRRCRGLVPTGRMMSHQFNRTILREYDVRGIVGTTLHPADATALGRMPRSPPRKAPSVSPSAATAARIRPNSKPRWSKACARAELDVVRIGLGPSPMLYFAVSTLDVDGGIQVTGNHNSSDYNGFKMLLRPLGVWFEIKDLGRRARATRATRCGHGRGA